MINQKFDLGIFKYWVASMLLLSMIACGSSPVRLPTAIEQANKTDQAAHRAIHDGDLLRAREMFKQSMLMQRSLENIPAAAMAAINLSSVDHKLGETPAALSLLDSILADDTALVPTELKAVAAYRKGIMLADTGRENEAELALQLAKKSCVNPCAMAAGINNLQARLMMKKGDFSAALTVAKCVLNGTAEKIEQANARRIAGAAESALGQHQTAFADYTSALELDKELALSMRIAEDLTGISKALLNLGRLDEADTFARRAEAVTSSMRMLGENTPNKP